LINGPAGYPPCSPVRSLSAREGTAADRLLLIVRHYHSIYSLVPPSQEPATRHIMDTFHPSVDPDCYRHIMSERRKIRRIHKGKEREIFRLKKELRSLWKQQGDILPVPLKEPYQYGWVRLFILEDDQKYRPETAFYEEILREINTYQYSLDKRFVRRRIRKNRHRGKYAIRPQALMRIRESHFNSPKCRLTPEQKRLFVRKRKWHTPSRSWEVKYEFTEPWRYKLVIRPRIITEYFPVDNLLESRIKEIELYFDERNLPLWDYADGWDYKSDFHHTGKNYNEIRNKPLRDIEAMAIKDTVSLWEI
jgi:hypothetical protein